MAPHSTGVVNLEDLGLLVTHSLARARRDGEFVSLVCIEVESDNARLTNLAMTQIAELLTMHLRASDVVAQIGERDLAVLLLQSDAAQSEVVLSQMGSLITGTNRTEHRISVTAHAGLATFDPADEDSGLDELLLAARSDLATRGRSWHG